MLAGSADGHHNILLADRVYNRSLLFIDQEQLVLFHKHIDDCGRPRQVADRLGGLNHDVPRLLIHNDLGKNADWVLLTLNIRIHLLHVVVGDRAIGGCAPGRFRTAAIVSVTLSSCLAGDGSTDHLGDVFLLVEQIGSADSDNLFMAALVHDQLVQRLQAK